MANGKNDLRSNYGNIKNRNKMLEEAANFDKITPISQVPPPKQTPPAPKPTPSASDKEPDDVFSQEWIDWETRRRKRLGIK